MSVVDEIKARLDIVSVIGRYTPLKKSGRNYKALCPFHNEKTPSFVVFPDTQTWRCFGQCGEGGDLFNFMMKKEGCDFREALQVLAKEAGVDLSSYRAAASPEQEAAQARLYSLLDEAARYFHELLPASPVHDYLLKRGLTPETAQAFMLGYAPQDWRGVLDYLTALGFTLEETLQAGIAVQREEDKRVYSRFRHRFMIPIRDSRGRVIGFGARALSDDQQPKYLNSPQSRLFDKSQLLFGLDRARRAIRESETAIIVEGYMDVIQAHQAGYTNVVATMGTALTKEHIQQLGKYAKRLVLALDADPAGAKATMRGLEIVREAAGDSSVYVLDANGMMKQAGRLKLDIRVLQLPSGKDPDDFVRQHPEAWEEQVSMALPLAEYLIKVGVASLPPNASVAQREALANELLPLLTATEDDLINAHNLQLLANKLRLDPSSFIQWSKSRQRHASVPPSEQRRERGRSAPKQHSHGNGKAAPPPAQRASAATRGRMLEQFCLNVLLHDPSRLFEAHRLLREVDKADNSPFNVPLQSEDFTQTEFQEIFKLLQRAARQDELEPLEYLHTHADSLLRQTLDEILMEPLALFIREAGKLYETELKSVQREQQRFNKKVFDEFPCRLLMLRRERVERQIKEIYFMMEEAQSEGNAAMLEYYTAQISEIKRAVKLLNAAISTQRNSQTT